MKRSTEISRTYANPIPVMLNRVQLLITIGDELRGFIPLSRGDQGVCFFFQRKRKEERGKSKNRSHERPLMKRSTEISRTYANPIPVMLNRVQLLIMRRFEIPNQGPNNSCFGIENVKAQMSKLSAVMLNWFQHLIKRRFEIPNQGPNNSCFDKNVKAQMSKLSAVMLNWFQHLNQPTSTGEIPKQVRDDSHCRTNVKAQMSKLTLALGRTTSQY